MVQYVEGGLDVMNAFFFAQPTENDVRMFQQNQQTLLQRINSNVVQPLTDFYQTIKSQVQTVSYDRLKSFARNMERKLFSFWESDDVIIPLTTLEDLQFPPHNMIRWLMANPVARAKYHKQEIAGYDDKYIDLAPGKIKDDHLDYQMVMDGLEVPGDEEDEVLYTTYINDENPELMDELSLSERLDIINSWEHMNYYLGKMEEDPTSQYSGML